jgi:hypothetical protein
LEDILKKLAISLSLVIGLLGIASTAHAQLSPVEYVKICSLYGAGFYYIPGTDTCVNDVTGDSRTQTEGGTWRSLIPSPQGKWVADPQLECAPGGRLQQVGNFKSTDFAVNAWATKSTTPVNFPVKPPQFISKVMMSGGFYDPRIPGNRGGAVGSLGGRLCLKPNDTILMRQGDEFVNFPWAGFLPIGCVDNSRIVGMPGAYEVTATAAYPNISIYFPTADQTIIAGPYIYGSSLIVTTDYPSRLGLTYRDGDVDKPMAGTLSVSVCVEGR